MEIGGGGSQGRGQFGARLSAAVGLNWKPAEPFPVGNIVKACRQPLLFVHIGL